MQKGYNPKNATDVDTSDFAKKADLASLKSDIHELDIGWLKHFCWFI